MVEEWMVRIVNSWIMGGYMSFERRNKNRGYQKLIKDEAFEYLDSLSFKIENGMLKLIESLQRKQVEGNWDDSLIVEESNSLYNQDIHP